MGITNRQIGSKIAPFTKTDNNGLFMFNSPLIGVVKNNIDPTCSGRLQVYIPQFGGADANNPTNWVTVAYSSPFRGQTKREPQTSEYVDTTVDYTDLNENSFQSYGIWFVPPDINLRVLCIFANGDPTQGYWIGCLQDPYSSRMTPGIGSVPAATPSTGGYIWDPTKFATHQFLKNYIQISDVNTGDVEIPYRLPVSEAILDGLNQNNANAYNTVFNNINSLKMVPHVNQTKILGQQGLAFDFSRGSTSASALRESPTQVFGISTPGRLSNFSNLSNTSNLIPLISQYAANSSVLSSTDQQTVTNVLSSKYRAGGHQFVMDDGTVDGYDQGIRIRSAQGNMILLDDTNGQIYIINSAGTSWIEMTPSGRIDIFTQSDFSIRSKGDINFHSDQDINLNAAGSINLHAEQNFKIEGATVSTKSAGTTTFFSIADIKVGASGKLTLFSSGSGSLQSAADLNIKGTSTNINSPGTLNVVADPGSIMQNKMIDVGQQPGTQAYWQIGTFNSIVSRSPAHEPWPDHEINTIRTFDVTQGTAGPLPIGHAAGNYKLSDAAFAIQPKPGSAIPGLTKTQTQALLAAIAQAETGFPNNHKIDNKTYFVWPSGPGIGSSISFYQAYSSYAYAGKYQFGAEALETQGYIKAGTCNAQRGKSGLNKRVLEGPYWTGKNNINNLNDWLNNGSEQEIAMLVYETMNYNYLVKHGAINKNTTAEQEGGLLYASQFGVGNATKFGVSGTAFSDGFGTPISNYYNRGQSAIAQANNYQIAGVSS